MAQKLPPTKTTTTTSQTKQQQKRAKVRLEFAEKLFYERVLTEWKDNINADNKNHAYVVKRALNNLTKFPLNVQGFVELRKIQGIGQDIATRLNAAWSYACEEHFGSDSPRLEQVKGLGRGEPFRLLEEASSRAGSGRKNGKVVPFVHKQQQHRPKAVAIGKEGKTIAPARDEQAALGSCSTAPGQQKLARSNSHEQLIDNEAFDMDYDELMNCSSSLPAFSARDQQASSSSSSSLPLTQRAAVSATTSSSSSITIKQKALQVKPSTSSSNVCIATTSTTAVEARASARGVEVQQQSHFLTYTPGKTIGDGRLLLIADKREGCLQGKKQQRKGKGVLEHLADMGVPNESRVLVVGDYLWLLQWVDWEGQRQELVLNYIVERKTWDDLKRSIRETRYIEQKSRLRRCGVANVVLVVEGGHSSDRSLEQAMVSTSIENGFLTHRTASQQGTAKFLQHLTKRLEEQWKSQTVRGPSFRWLQANCAKAKPTTIADCWLRQLTVCPGMSVDRAQAIRQRFPTFRAMAQFYRKALRLREGGDKFGEGQNGVDVEGQSLLARELPTVPMAVSKQLYVFFRRALSAD